MRANRTLDTIDCPVCAARDAADAQAKERDVIVQLAVSAALLALLKLSPAPVTRRDREPDPSTGGPPR